MRSGDSKGVLTLPRSETSRHAGSVVIVTGAASGIGQATVLRLAAEGALVVGCDADSSGLATTARELADCHELHQLDVTNQTQVEDLVRHTVSRHGRIDALANVAGIMDGFLVAHEVDDPTWERVMAVNVGGPLRLARAAIPTMLEQGSGAIVNIASEAGLRGGAAGAAYTTSKHALVGLTRSIAWTYAPQGLRCNAICPGPVDTNIAGVRRSDYARERQSAVAALSVRRAQPDEIAGTISWLLAADAMNINGAVLAADGGWMAG
jgi:NAD(P)-dependent dehydrogenase (short-subunit alcohol dehydrogenase family)